MDALCSVARTIRLFTDNTVRTQPTLGTSKCHNVIALFAQVGSGFDVSAAVYGTHTYTRFSPSWLADALSAGDAPSVAAARPESAQDSAGNSPPLERIAKCVRGRGGWDAERGQLRLPSCFRLLMGDVCGGSSTPSMVRKVGCMLETTLFVFC